MQQSGTKCCRRWIPCWGSRSCHRWQGLQISDHRRSSCAGHSTVDPPPHSDSVTILWLPTEDRMTDDASLVVCCGVDLWPDHPIQWAKTQIVFFSFLLIKWASLRQGGPGCFFFIFWTVWDCSKVNQHGSQQKKTCQFGFSVQKPIDLPIDTLIGGVSNEG